MSGQRIAIIGPAMRCGMVAALLARQWVGLGRRLLVLADWSNESGEVLMRPGFARFHGEIGLDVPKGRPAFAYDVETEGGTVTLPFAPYGIANRGVAFHHFWTRANMLGDEVQLADYSLALRLHGTEQSDPSMIAGLPLETGLWVVRGDYAKALLKHASTDEGGTLESCDLVIDCGAEASSWSGRTIAIHADQTIAGVEWLATVNAARRIARLAANFNDAGPARHEYIRLSEHEADRIGDMRSLLSGASSSPALERKIALFEACGRIPMEDFEIFTQAEWLAALWAKNYRPARYDRMADAVPADELKRWLQGLETQISQLSGKCGSA